MMTSIDKLHEALTTEAPNWATGTILLRDADGSICAYAYLDRKRGEIEIEASPNGVRLLRGEELHA